MYLIVLNVFVFSYLYHCVVDNGIIYLCAAKPDFGKQQPYNFLAEVVIFSLCVSNYKLVNKLED